MGRTRYYGLSFFDFGSEIDSALNVQNEIERFVVIDKQLYGLYNVFGNGVIEGWDVNDIGYSTENGISISISVGMGIIKYMAAQTSITFALNYLPSNRTVDIYAIITGSTTRNRDVDFVYSVSGSSVTDGVKIATVVTGNNSIQLIDNTVKDYVGFQDIIQDEISKHKHRGSPSKIDLQSETKNQLPGSRIESVDASKITSGIFDIDRIPIVDHNDLSNTGLVSHAALDTFVEVLQNNGNNKELLGEISTVNLMNTIVYLKYLYSDIDKHFINELSLIPGISSDDFIDFGSSTANISLESQCISGIPAQTGIYTDVYWNSQYAFYNAHSKNNVTVSNGQVSLDKTGVELDIIDDFETSSIIGASVPGFTKEIITQEEVNILSNNDSYEGTYSAKFNASFASEVVYVKEINPINGASTRSWVDKYNELVLYVKTSTDTHEAVYLHLVNGEGESEVVFPQEKGWTILEKNYVTSSDNNNFEEKVFDISSYNLNDVRKIVITTSDTNSNFSFQIDNIHVRRRNLYIPNGYIRFRYSTESDVVFHSLDWEDGLSVPDGTEVNIRIKVANSIDLLNRASYIDHYLHSGEIFGLSGTAAEIEVLLNTNDYTVSPVLNSLRLRLLVDGDFSGFSLSDKSDWERGSLNNVSLEDNAVSGSDIVIKNPINVGGYSFLNKDAVSEISDSKIGVLGFNGTRMPISPNQAANWNNSSKYKFRGSTSIKRKYNKNYLVADTYNNRVLEVDQNGNLVKGIGSTYVNDDRYLYPLNVIYNNTNHILTVVFSKDFTLNDITKIILYVDKEKISLTINDIVLDSYSNKILKIQINENIWTRLGNISESLYFKADTGSFSEDIVFSPESSKLNSVLYGIKCFIGDFTYVDGIKHPIFVNILDNNNWVILNSSMMYFDSENDINTEENNFQEFSEVAPLLEYDIENHEIAFTYDKIKFSDFSLGGAYEFEDGKYIVAGVVDGDSFSTNFTSEDLLSSENTNSKIRKRAAAIDALQGYKGVISVIDKINNQYTIFYNSPDGLYPTHVSPCSNGDMIVSESSFAESSGRIIKLDEYGNIKWVYGTGVFNIINDVYESANKDIVVSV